MIAVAAYYCAERRGFAPGQEMQDWWDATAAIDAMLENMFAAGVSRGEYARAGLRNALRLWVDQASGSVPEKVSSASARDVSRSMSSSVPGNRLSRQGGNGERR